MGDRTGNLWHLPIQLPPTPSTTYGPPPGLPTLSASNHLASANNSPLSTANPSPTASLTTSLNAYQMPLDNPGIMLFWQKCLGSPTKSTLVQAAVKGLLPWSVLTPTYIRKWYVPSIATSKGHLHRMKAGVQTTHIPISSQPTITPTAPDANTLTINISTFNMRNALHTDTQAAITKKHCVLIATVPRFHFIHIIAMPANPTNAQIVPDYNKLHQNSPYNFAATSVTTS